MCILYEIGYSCNDTRCATHLEAYATYCCVLKADNTNGACGRVERRRYVERLKYPCYRCNNMTHFNPSVRTMRIRRNGRERRWWRHYPNTGVDEKADECSNQKLKMKWMKESRLYQVDPDMPRDVGSWSEELWRAYFKKQENDWIEVYGIQKEDGDGQIHDASEDSRSSALKRYSGMVMGTAPVAREQIRR